MRVESEIKFGIYLDKFEDNLDEWILAVISLRWNRPIFEVARWPTREIKRHLRAYQYELQKAKQKAEEQEDNG